MCNKANKPLSPLAKLLNKRPSAYNLARSMVKDGANVAEALRAVADARLERANRIGRK